MASPPMRTDWAATMSARLSTATSVVPPPMSQTMLATGSAMGSPTPMAAALASGIKPDLAGAGPLDAVEHGPLLDRRDAARHADQHARLQPPAAAAAPCGGNSGASPRRARNRRSRRRPSGRTTAIDSGVRPCICLARWPTAQPPERMRPVPCWTATTEGSLSTSPSPTTRDQRVGRSQVDGQVGAEVVERSRSIRAQDNRIRRKDKGGASARHPLYFILDPLPFTRGRHLHARRPAQPLPRVRP